MEEKTNLNENEQKVEETNEIVATESTKANSNDGKHEIDVLKEAEKINSEMKKENDRKQKLLDREEKLLARQETLRALGGGSPAGQTPTKPAEETPREYAKRLTGGKL